MEDRPIRVPRLPSLSNSPSSSTSSVAFSLPASMTRNSWEVGVWRMSCPRRSFVERCSFASTVSLGRSLPSFSSFRTEEGFDYSGHSAVRTVVLDTLLKFLAEGLTPVVPLRGSISASGDLSPVRPSFPSMTLTDHDAALIHCWCHHRSPRYQGHHSQGHHARPCRSRRIWYREDCHGTQGGSRTSEWYRRLRFVPSFRERSTRRLTMRLGQLRLVAWSCTTRTSCPFCRRLRRP